MTSINEPLEGEILPLVRHPGGRPTSFDPEKAVAIVAAVRGGCYLDTAAALGGVSRGTLRTWIRNGKRKRTPELTSFAEAIERASAEAERNAVETILKASENQWQAAAWWLERTRPEEYGRQARISVDIILEEEVKRAAKIEGLDAALVLREARRVYAVLQDH